jgi:prepilin-type N-terminal cleavage/methylation domain-containing protein
MRRRSKGFTLIEIAIVIAIIGLIAAGMTAMLTTFLKSTRSRVAADNATVVEQSLQRFIERFGRLPCPAVPTLSPGTSGYGVEDSIVTSCAATAIGTTGIARGVVPWVTLGLSLDQVQDGYARMFTYNVTIAATQTNSSTISPTKGNMTIHSGTPTVMGLPPAGNQINSCWTGSVPVATENSCNMDAVVVLVSHGENGLGAYTSQGGQLDVPTSAGELENVDANVKFVKGDTNATGFDDVVFAWSPDDLFEPLARQGTLKSATAITNDTLRNTALAISNAIVSAATNCGTPPCGSGNWPTALIPAFVAPTVLVPCGSVQGVALPTDAYAANTAGDNICGTTTGSFTLTSWGLDGLTFASPPTNPNTNRYDDIVLTVTVDQIRSQLNTRFPSC